METCDNKYRSSKAPSGLALRAGLPGLKPSNHLRGSQRSVQLAHSQRIAHSRKRREGSRQDRVAPERRRATEGGVEGTPKREREAAAQQPKAGEQGQAGKPAQGDGIGDCRGTTHPKRPGAAT